MNENDQSSPATIPSGKVAADLGLVLITGIAITIVAVVLNPWLGCSKKHLWSRRGDLCEQLFEQGFRIFHLGTCPFVFLEDGFDGVPGGFSRSRVGADHPFPKHWRKGKKDP
ncbi:hypothetical protein Tco_0854236 [Tanacetum coccineum]